MNKNVNNVKGYWRIGTGELAYGNNLGLPKDLVVKIATSMDSLRLVRSLRDAFSKL